MRKLIIRADGGSTIGLGHLVRCFALACMVKESFKIIFYSMEIPEKLGNDIKFAGFGIEGISNEHEFLTAIQKDDVVVLDSYKFDLQYQKDVKSKAALLILVDDLHNREFLADLIINHSPGVSAIDYVCTNHPQFALGGDYSLIRPAFLKAAREEDFNKRTDTAFICFGGSDPLGLTESSLKALLELDKFSCILVVIGEGNKSFSLTRLEGFDLSCVQVYQSLSEDSMLTLMKSARIAIVPSSGVLLEAIAAGCIPVSGLYVENQRFIYQSYKDVGAIVDAKTFNDEDLKQAVIAALHKNPKSFRLIDGNSGQRIQKYLNQLVRGLSMNLRKATLLDLEQSFAWASDPLIREFSLNRKIIKKDEHISWFSNKIRDPRCFYFIAEYMSVSVGSIRFDIDNDLGVISYLIDKNWQGMGFGQTILFRGLELLESELKNVSYKVDQVVGYVMMDNIASRRIFTKLGYLESFKDNLFLYHKNLKLNGI